MTNTEEYTYTCLTRKSDIIHPFALQKIFATPLSITQTREAPFPMARQHSHQQSELDYENSTYLSRRMHINEVCIFKTSVDAFSDTTSSFKNTKLYLFCELMLFNKDEIVTVGRFESCTDGLVTNAFLPIYFEEYRFTSCVEGSFHSRIVTFKYNDNRESIRQLIDRRSISQKNNHISKITGIKIPVNFESFSEFLSYATNDYSKAFVQRFYDMYVGELRLQANSMKELITKYLECSQSRTILQHTNIKLVNYLSKPLPFPTHLSKRQKKRIFEGSNDCSITFDKIDRSLTTISNSDLRDDSTRIGELTLSPSILEECFLKDFNLLGITIYELWGEFLKLLLHSSSSDKYMQSLRETYINQLHRAHRKNNLLLEGANQPIDQEFLQPALDQINPNKTLFNVDNNYLLLSKPNLPKPKRHLVVFLHGFQAYAIDMQSIRNYIKYLFPYTQTFVSSVNENRTENSIEDLGQRFALQLKNYLNEHPYLSELSISFVCHSLGSLIARAALPYLQFFKDHFCYFISLSSPHLGYLYHSSTIIKTSLWVLNKMNSSQSMKQLCFEDQVLNNASFSAQKDGKSRGTSSVENCYLYHLSQAKGLEWFKKLILFGSREDQYVFLSSARIQMAPEALSSNDDKSRVYQTMINNIMSPLKPENVVRLDVKFDIKNKDLNALIGRTAHIQILSDKFSIKAFLALFYTLF